jgi:hypothetical protein
MDRNPMRDPFYMGIPYDFSMLVGEEDEWLHATQAEGKIKVSSLNDLRKQYKATRFFRRLFYCVACETNQFAK